ncbi:hypothetical protein Zmor_015607 [Zophobas morio]|uniref:Uncharacterized protein n=1 Tax=Zophobas morio TaxID=2755281 RepID=A0AA38IJR5_9CUCU|nr:hypothetical protein Zmor_015607 [Zophobas morio]
MSTKTVTLLPDGVLARAEFGAPGCGCFPPTTVILLYRQAHATHHPSVIKKCAAHKQAVEVANSWLGPGYWAKAIASHHLDRPLTSILNLRLLCRWRDRQLDKETRTPLPPRVSVLFTSVPFKCSLCLTLILNYN